MLEAILGLSIYGIDRKAKEYAETSLSMNESKSVCKGWIKLILHHNYGFAANMGSDRPVVIKAVSVAFTIALSALYIFSLTLAGKRFLKFGLSFLLGGAFSNTYDRVKNGYVTDYFQIGKGPRFVRKFIWNIADFAIMIGAMLICV